MSLGDLRRLIHRATPRVEDVRAPDRTDIIRKEHGHLSFREVVDALDALEFSAGAFLERMREHLPSEEVTGDAMAVDDGAPTDAAIIQGTSPSPFEAYRDALANSGTDDVADAAASKAPAFTAIHGLFRALDGIRFTSACFAEPAASSVVAADGEEEAAEGAAQPEEAAAARQRGGEKFKNKDFAGAVEDYTAAIRATARASDDLHTLYSNRSAAQLKIASGDATASLRDARRCVELAPKWPKAYFRAGTCLRQLGFLAESTAAFREGERLEPENKDWPKEIEGTEQLRRAQPPAIVRQLLFNMLPELLAAYVRGAEGAAPGGVLQVQVRGEFKDLGASKWQLLRDKKAPAKAQLRFAYLDRKDYLANLAANVQSPPDGVAKVDFEDKAMKIAEFGGFLPTEGSGTAAIHLDLQGGPGGKMFGILCLVPCDAEIREKFLRIPKDPPAPKGSVENVLNLQKNSGFPKGLPKLLGFQSLPGDLNFPVIDLKRDMPSA